MRKNIKLLFVMRALTWFMVMMPILVLFYQDNGLNMQQVFWVQAVFSIAVVLFEIPSGYFADLFGRKKSMIIGSIGYAMGLAIYSISNDFCFFLVAETVMAIGVSFISGADSALLYDSLLAQKKEKDYKKIAGRYLSVGNFSEGLAAILGGFLAVSSLRYPVIAQALVVALAIPFTFFITEPRRQFMEIAEGNLKKIISVIKYALHEHKEIKWLIIYSSILGTATMVIVWFIQPYFKHVGLPLALFGVAWAILQFSVGLFSLFAHQYEKLLGKKKSLISLSVVSTLGFFLMAIFDSLWGVVFVFLFYFARGIKHPILEEYTNKLISSDIRATVLSIKSLVFRVSFAIVGPFLGWVSDFYSIKTALISSGFIFLILGFISLLGLSKNKVI